MTEDGDPAAIEVLLAELCREHRALDGEIARLVDGPAPDQLALQRLKRRKLALKDRIARLESARFPDIIA